MCSSDLIDKALKDTEADIQSFQTEKQGKLNELHVVVTLQMSQVKHLAENVLPSDLTSDLIFPSEELEKLRARIKELAEEKMALRKRQKALRTEHVTLHKEQSSKGEKLRELDAFLEQCTPLLEAQLQRNLTSRAFDGHEVTWEEQYDNVACLHSLKHRGPLSKSATENPLESCTCVAWLAHQACTAATCHSASGCIASASITRLSSPISKRIALCACTQPSCASAVFHRCALSGRYLGSADRKSVV